MSLKIRRELQTLRDTALCTHDAEGRNCHCPLGRLLGTVPALPVTHDCPANCQREVRARHLPSTLRRMDLASHGDGSVSAPCSSPASTLAPLKFFSHEAVTEHFHGALGWRSYETSRKMQTATRSLQLPGSRLASAPLCSVPHLCLQGRWPMAVFWPRAPSSPRPQSSEPWDGCCFSLQLRPQLWAELAAPHPPASSLRGPPLATTQSDTFPVLIAFHDLCPLPLLWTVNAVTRILSTSSGPHS